MAQLTPSLKEEIMSIKDPVIRSHWQRFFAIPQDLQQALFGEPFAENVWDITSEKYNLPDTSVSKVARIIGLIFLGELPIKNFIAALRDELKIDVAKASAIAQDINTAIFQPVRESLMAVHGISQTNADYTPHQSANAHGTGQARTNADSQHNINNLNKIQNPKHETPNLEADAPHRYGAGNFQNPRLRQDFGGQAISKIPNNAPPPVSLDELDKHRPARTYADQNADLRRNNNTSNSGRAPSSKIQDPRSGIQARPAAIYNIPAKNVVDLRKLARKRYNKKRYDGFFSA